MPIPPDVREEIAARFRAQYIEDQAAGTVRELADYIADAPPEHQEVIAEEYLALRGTPREQAPGEGIGHSLSGIEPDSALIGPYRILRELGRGGQATVYLAEDTRLHRRVALKVLTGLGRLEGDSLNRFHREAAVASKLDHPGICGVHEAGVEGGVAYIAMRYVEGDTLASTIEASRRGTDGDRSAEFFVNLSDDEGADPRARGSLTPSRSTKQDVLKVAETIERAARALHEAHEAGIVHRDIKPGNIMLTPKGEPVVLDFGLARDLDGDDPTLTRTGDLFGTPAYMAPEQLMAQRIRVDRRADVWALGVTLYEALTLARPFEAPTREGVYQAIQFKDPTRPSRHNPSISSDLEVVIATALEKDCDRRYQTALDLAEELRRVRMHEPILAKPIGPLFRLQRWAQRNPALAASVAGLFAVLAIGLTVALLLLQRSERERVAKERALGEKAKALEDVTTERNEKRAALSDYDRLGDLSRLQALQAEANMLWPADPSHVPGMKAWVEQAAALGERLDGHRRLLEELRKAGVKVVPDSRPGESRTADSGSTWQFRSDAAQFKHDTTQKLVADLTAFVDPVSKKGLIADVRSRLAFAESVERETIGRYQTKWADAIRSIADKNECPKYNGLRIKPQLGLIPIAKDPASGLWEFVRLQTVAPGTDPIPKRGQDGRLVVTEDMGIVFVLLPGGTFRMGAMKQPPDEDTPMSAPNLDPEANADESPVTEVTLEPFFLSKYEMTQGQWLRLVGKNPSQYGPGSSFGGKIVDLRNPVEQVSWEDCDLWLTRLGLELPTEAQWEYGARGGTTTPRWTGFGTDGLAKAENLADQFGKENGGPPNWKYEPWNDGYTVHAPVGSFDANPFGLHDVLGNVREWCRDWSGRYSLKPRSGDGLRSSSASRVRVLRGGSFSNVASLARSAYRNGGSPEVRYGILGVRPVGQCPHD